MPSGCSTAQPCEGQTWLSDPGRFPLQRGEKVGFSLKENRPCHSCAVRGLGLVTVHIT